MSTTVSTFLNNIPATAPEYPLAQSILSKISLAANASNFAHGNAAKSELPGLLNQLLSSLIDRRRLSAATLLALAASAGSTNGYVLPDLGILGTVTVSGSAITLAAGAGY